MRLIPLIRTVLWIGLLLAFHFGKASAQTPAPAAPQAAPAVPASLPAAERPDLLALANGGVILSKSSEYGGG